MTKSPSRLADITSYVNDISQFPIASKEEQIALVKKAQAGDAGARDRLFQSNLRLVISIAKRYYHPGLELNDLIQHGNLGLIHALEKYDPEMGYSFTTYAIFWIKQKILRAIAYSDLIRKPCQIHNSFQRLRKVRKELTQELGREASPEEIAERMRVPLKQVMVLLEVYLGVMSLDFAAGEDDTTFKDLLVDPESLSPEDSAGETSLKNAVLPLLDILSPRDRGIMMLRFGLNGHGGKAHTLEEVAGQYDLTRERIRQIEVTSLKKLRRSLRRQGKELSDFM